jgi:pimeloyl-ACP methyl ester carboxylesterase
MLACKPRPAAFFAALLLFLAAGAQAREHVSFPTQDGGVVYADLYGAGDRGVVLAHGGQFNKESWAKQARTLADKGFRVLAFDFRGFGPSRGPHGKSGDDIEQGVEYDVLAAVRYLHEHGAKTVSVVGASFGGWAAALASIAAKPGEIDRVVLLAASPVDEPEKIKGRKLFIVARDDTEGDRTVRLSYIREQYEKAAPPKQLIVLDGSAHAQFLFQTNQAERLMQEILRFLSEP